MTKDKKPRKSRREFIKGAGKSAIAAAIITPGFPSIV
jgi:hypothetical protein